jgi:hypothetical protein
VTLLKNTFAAIWVALTSFTIAQLNALLGAVSLVLGICYQVWKWRREASKSHLDGKD